MYYENKLSPTEEQIEEFLTPLGRPIHMLNLLKFREKSSYPDGKDRHLSGREAYARYTKEAAKILHEMGGKIEFVADISRLMLGDVEELWDAVAIASYPSRETMLKMIQSDAYQSIHIHREAGLAGQLNIETIKAGH
ncbi:MAG: DUF1330 domain-containing protein [Halieaceae bacterium]|nr:DUF1330 domain-containing protein [Halieaceae bacterium]